MDTQHESRCMATRVCCEVGVEFEVVELPDDAIAAEEDERLVQLGRCLCAARGIGVELTKGEFGWSYAYQVTLELRRERDRLELELAALRARHEPDTLTGDEYPLHCVVMINASPIGTNHGPWHTLPEAQAKLDELEEEYAGSGRTFAVRKCRRVRASEVGMYHDAEDLRAAFRERAEELGGFWAPSWDDDVVCWRGTTGKEGTDDPARLDALQRANEGLMAWADVHLKLDLFDTAAG